MNDTEDQNHPVRFDDVEHHSVVAYAQSLERVAGASNRLNRFRPARGGAEPAQRSRNLLSYVDRKLLERPCRRGREMDGVLAQARSSSRSVRPAA